MKYYTYNIEFTNYRGKVSKHKFVATNINTLSELLFNRFGSNYVNYCRVISATPIEKIS